MNMKTRSPYRTKGDNQEPTTADQLRETFKSIQAETLALREKAEATEKQLEKTQAELEKAKSNSEESDRLKAQIDELKDEISDIRTKAANSNFVPDSKEREKSAVKSIVVEAIKERAKSGSVGNIFDYVEKHARDVFKSANITNANDGAVSVANTLARDIAVYADEKSTLLGLLGARGSLTRNWTRMVRVVHAATRAGQEHNALETQEVTDTAKYKTVMSNVFKIEAQPLFSTEVLKGADVDVYNDIVSDIGGEMIKAIVDELLFGTTAVNSPSQVATSDSHARGILGSRIDIAGESLKPTMAATVVGARNPDIYPILSTGVAGAMGTDDTSSTNFLLRFMRKLPTDYRKNSVLMMNEDTLYAIEILRDLQGRPVFEVRYDEAGDPIIKGRKVVIEPKMPSIEDGGAFIIYGDLAQAMFVKEGEASEMVVDPYTNKGSTIIYYAKEMFEAMGKSDAILIAVATAEAGGE